MATPYRSEYLELSYGATTLMCGSRAIDCYRYDDLYRVGDSQGSNRKAGGVAGTSARPRSRGELPAELQFEVSGRWTVDNVAISGAARRPSCLDRIREVRDFLDGAPDGQLTVTVHELDASAEDRTFAADGQFEAMGRLQFEAGDLVKFAVLLTIHGGLVEASP